MKTIVITGGASGIGKGLAMHYLEKGNRVIAIGSSAKNGEAFCKESEKMGALDRAVYINANLSLVNENQRVVEEIKNRFSILDMIIFCASKHNKKYIETKDGLEFTFSLDYLSRFILSYGLKELLEKASNPIILNMCGTGMKGEVNWDDLQHKKSFKSFKVMMHGSRLNDLSGVAFTQNDNNKKIKYVLYNPMAVQTPGMMEFGGLFLKIMYKFIAKPVEEAILPIVDILNNPPTPTFSAYKERELLDLNLRSYNKDNAMKLYNTTIQIINNIG